MTNRLAEELSPYLRQHAGNPVEWYPWGDEPIQRARREEKPIFLSIGYSSCHWCHVMAHESFEDESIARQLADGFVSVKVDREERPEIDQIYMEAVQAMTGHGGWPLSVFLTPTLEPFFGGTYWPARTRRGVPGFGEVLRAVQDAWATRRDEVVAQATRITQFLDENRYDSQGPRELDARPISLAEDALRQAFDAEHGGFGAAPKFPQPLALELLLRRARGTNRPELLDLATKTLDAMARGGIYDQLGGGFHRYTVDAAWLVPHFEKMLYDNALLARCYVEAFAAGGDARFERVARETLDYLLRDMREPGGGIASSEDADSEGDEGRFYVWTPAEIREGLLEMPSPPRPIDALAADFCRVYDVSETGNFEGRNILHLSRSIEQSAALLGRPVQELTAELAECRRHLFATRSRRPRPGRDDKVIVSWNALAIDALARAGAVLGEDRYRRAAAGAADFLLTELRDDAGRLLHCWRNGRAKVPAMLDDIAGLADALVTLHETTGESRWLVAAVALADDMIERFGDRQAGGFFYTGVDHDSMIARKKDVLDASVPSGNGMAATALVRLARLAGRPDYRDAAGAALRTFYDFMRQMPTAAGQMLLALDLYLELDHANP